MTQLSSVFQSKAHKAALQPYFSKYPWEFIRVIPLDSQGVSLRWDCICMQALYKLNSMYNKGLDSYIVIWELLHHKFWKPKL